MMHGVPVELEEMLACRERRAALQKGYMRQYGLPIVSFCMNIPGPVKSGVLIRRAFAEGRLRALEALHRVGASILAETVHYEHTGDEWIVSVDGDAQSIKDALIAVEEAHPLGRLFDLDVMNAQGDKLSRTDCRRCLLCDRQAQECARTRTHTVEEMQEHIERLLRGYFGA